MGGRILVVDDDPWILRMVTATLRKRDFSVETARDGRQALDRVKANLPDVIISDVMMPIMDGWTFVKQLRQDPRTATIPVIFLTALSKDETKLRALGLTDDDFLPKPFRFDELDRKVDAALASRRAASPPQGYGANQSSGLHNPPPPSQSSGVHHLPPPNQSSGVHNLPPPNQSSGVHPMPGNPYPYPPGQYPAQYPPHYGQYPGPYPPPQPGPYPGQYPPQYPPPTPGQYPPQYPPPPPGQYPAAGPPAASPPAAGPPAAAPQQDAPVAPTTPRGGAASPQRATGLHGKLEQLGLSSLLVMMEMERKQGVLTLMEPGREALGRVFLRGGRVVLATLDAEPSLSERECVYRMLGWKAGTFSFSATVVDAEDTVQSSTTHLLMEGARLIDEAGRGDKGL